MSANDGGPAFSCPEISQDSSTGATTIYQWSGPGVSVRDYFAAKAPAQEIADAVPSTRAAAAEKLGVDESNYTIKDYVRLLAMLRYEWADAMLAERLKS